MLRVPQHHPGHKQRGRGCCAISERPRPSPFAPSSLFCMLSPTIPVHTRSSSVSPIIPVHTQKQGGGGYPKEAKEAKEVKEVKEADHHRAFLTHVFTITLSNIVGAPTFQYPKRMCRASGAGNHHANRTQRSPFDSAQGRRAGLTSGAPTALRTEDGLSSKTEIELSVDFMRKCSDERQYKEYEERVTQKKIHAGERWLRVVLHTKDL